MSLVFPLPDANLGATLPPASAIGCYRRFRRPWLRRRPASRLATHQTFRFPLNFRNVFTGQDQAVPGFCPELGNKIQVALFNSPLVATKNSNVFGSNLCITVSLNGMNCGIGAPLEVRQRESLPSTQTARKFPRSFTRKLYVEVAPCVAVGVYRQRGERIVMEMT